MGLSFHDQPSLVEITSALRFGSDASHSNSIAETESHSIDYKGNRDDDIGVQRLESNNDIHQESRDDDSGIIKLFRYEQIGEP